MGKSLTDWERIPIHTALTGGYDALQKVRLQLGNDPSVVIGGWARSRRFDEEQRSFRGAICTVIGGQVSEAQYR